MARTVTRDGRRGPVRRQVIHVMGSVIYTITAPYAATALTLYYFDLDARKRGR